MADPPNNRRAGKVGGVDGCDHPLGHNKKHGESKSRLQELILEEVSRQLSRQSNPNDQTRAPAPAGSFSDHHDTPPLIIFGNVQHLSLGSGQTPAVMGSDVHYQPQHSAYFSGARNVSITGGISRSIRHCEQGHGEKSTASDGSPRKPHGAGDGSITVVDGEVHNPNVQLQSLRYFDGANGFTISGDAVMNAHQPVTHTPVDEETFPTPPPCDDESALAATATQLDVSGATTFVRAGNATASSPLRSAHSSSVVVPPEPPMHDHHHHHSSPANALTLSLSPHAHLVTPSPYHPRWEHHHRAATTANMSPRPSSDLDRLLYSGAVDGADSSLRASGSASLPAGSPGGEAKARSRMRAPGRSWLFGRRLKKKSREVDEEQFF